MGIALRCTVGPCAGQVIVIDSELTLGREEPEPGRLGGDARLSRRHARVLIDDAGRLVVEDLGSTNGTWVNEQRLTEARTCSNGDVLRMGQSSFDVVIPVAPAETRMDMAAPLAAPTVAEQAPAAARLRVIAGPREGGEIPLEHELLIGRSFGEPGSLGGDRRLSRRHARIAQGPGGAFFVEDTGSSNGTSINGTPLRRTRALQDGDEIELGSSRLVACGLPPALVDVAQRDDAPHAAPPGPGRRLPPAAAIGAAPQAARFGAQFVPQGAAGTRISSRRGRVIGVFAAVFLAAAAAAVLVIVLAAPLGSRSCPSGFICHPPPSAPPLHAAMAFTGSLGWRVEYDPQFAKATIAKASANELVLNESNTYDKSVLGVSSDSNLIGVVIQGFRTSQTSPSAALTAMVNQLSSHLIGAATAPSSDQLFGRPALGFHPAVSEVLEGNTQTPQGPGPLVKLAVMSAASDGVTLAMGFVYPVQQGRSQQNNPDRAYDGLGDQVVGTVRFPGDGAT